MNAARWLLARSPRRASGHGVSPTASRWPDRKSSPCSGSAGSSQPTSRRSRSLSASAVGTEKAEDDTCLHRERDVVDRGEAVEALDQIAGLNGRGMILPTIPLGRSCSYDPLRHGFCGHPEPSVRQARRGEGVIVWCCPMREFDRRRWRRMLRCQSLPS